MGRSKSFVVKVSCGGRPRTNPETCKRDSHAKAAQGLTIESAIANRAAALPYAHRFYRSPCV